MTMNLCLGICKCGSAGTLGFDCMDCHDHEYQRIYLHDDPNAPYLNPQKWAEKHDHPVHVINPVENNPIEIFPKRPFTITSTTIDDYLAWAAQHDRSQIIKLEKQTATRHAAFVSRGYYPASPTTSGGWGGPQTSDSRVARRIGGGWGTATSATTEPTPPRITEAQAFVMDRMLEQESSSDDEQVDPQNVTYINAEDFRYQAIDLPTQVPYQPVMNEDQAELIRDIILKSEDKEN